MNLEKSRPVSFDVELSQPNKKMLNGRVFQGKKRPKRKGDAEVDIERRSSQEEFHIATSVLQVLLLMEEIRRSPVEVGSLSQYLQGPIHPMCFFFGISSINSITQKLIKCSFKTGLQKMTDLPPIG